MKITELFAGIGGFKRGIDYSLGDSAEYVFISEKDPYAVKSYQAIHGETHHIHGDITKIHEFEVPLHDMLVGGFPCQSFSMAGNRKGLADTRGTMFFHVVRIAQARQPAVIFLENVKGLLSHDNGKTIEIMLKLLSEIGYRVDFEVINSKYFNVAQDRERVFIVAFRKDLVKGEAWRKTKGSRLIRKVKRKLSAHPSIDSFHFDFPSILSQKEAIELERLNRSINRYEKKIKEQNVLSATEKKDLKRALQEKEKIIQGKKEVTRNLYSILEDHVDPSYYYDDKQINTILNEQLPSHINPEKLNMIGRLDIKGTDSIRRVYHPEGLCPTLTTVSGGHVEHKICHEIKIPIYKRKYTINEQALQRTIRFAYENSPYTLQQISQQLDTPSTTVAHWLRADDSFTVPCHRKWNEFKQLLGITTDEFDDAILTLERKENTFELLNRVYDDIGLAATLQSSQNILERRTQKVRRLTPLEYWRLQGFLDDDFYRAQKAGVSNRQLYKQAGNAVTITVIQAITDAIQERLIREKYTFL